MDNTAELLPAIYFPLNWLISNEYKISYFHDQQTWMKNTE